MDWDSQPLTPREKAELQRLREDERNRKLRQELDRRRAESPSSTDQQQKLGCLVLLIVTLGLPSLFLPMLAFHGPTDASGHWTMNSTTWVAEGVWLAVLAVVVVLVTIIRSGFTKP